MWYGRSIKTCATGEKAIADPVIPSGVTAIPDFAFSGCGALTGMNVPSGVTSIGDRAFECCRNLKSITIPVSVTHIGTYAFSNCDSLQYNEYDSGFYLGNDENPYVVLIKAKNKNITSCTVHGGTNVLYGYAFCYCRALMGLTFAEDSRLTSIGRFVFYHCERLVHITIPRSVTSIGESAFYGCSRLTNITYKGTKAQWGEISKGYDWNRHTGDYVVTCTDGTLSKSASVF